MEVVEKMERETGIEPATSSLGSWRSTAELLPLKHYGNRIRTRDFGFRRLDRIILARTRSKRANDESDICKSELVPIAVATIHGWLTRKLG